jgi:hypothetical protein
MLPRTTLHESQRRGALLAVMSDLGHVGQVQQAARCRETRAIDPGRVSAPVVALTHL